MVCSERPPNGAPQHIVNFAQNGIRPAMLIETHPRSALAFGSFGREGLSSSCTHPAVAHLAVNASKTRIKMLSLMGHFCRWWVLTECGKVPTHLSSIARQQPVMLPSWEGSGPGLSLCPAPVYACHQPLSHGAQSTSVWHPGFKSPSPSFQSGSVR